MELTALGTCGIYPGPQRACAGWLVTSGTTRLLLDCGPGVISNLQTYVPLSALSAVLITHLHADHFLDLIPLRYARKYGPREERSRPVLYLPQGGLAALLQSAAALDPDPDFFTLWFDVIEYSPGAALGVGDLRLALVPTAHPIPTCAVGMTAPDGRRAVYSSDTGPSEAVVNLARGADLFICEATLATADDEAGRERSHLAPAEAADLAARANVKQLVLTHIPPYREPAAAVAVAREHFAGSVVAAYEGDVFQV